MSLTRRHIDVSDKNVILMSVAKPLHWCHWHIWKRHTNVIGKFENIILMSLTKTSYWCHLNTASCIPTVWYVVVFIFVIFRQCGMLCFSYLFYSAREVCCVLHFTSTNHGCFHILQSNYCDFSYSYQIVISTHYINFWKSHCYLSNK
jgi:hypothetical protein